MHDLPFQPITRSTVRFRVAFGWACVGAMFALLGGWLGLRQMEARQAIASARVAVVCLPVIDRGEAAPNAYASAAVFRRQKMKTPAVAAAGVVESWSTP